MNSSVPVLCADPKHPGTVSWGCDSLTVTSTGGSKLDAGPSTSPTGSALSHLPPGLGSPGSELPAQHPRREGWMKQQPQEMLLNLSKQPQGLLWQCDPFSLLLWGFLTLFSCFPTSRWSQLTPCLVSFRRPGRRAGKSAGSAKQLPQGHQGAGEAKQSQHCPCPQAQGCLRWHDQSISAIACGAGNPAGP